MERIKVYGNITVYDEEFRKIHEVTMTSWIEIDDDEDEWTAMSRAADMWLQMFDGYGNVDVDEVWT